MEHMLTPAPDETTCVCVYIGSGLHIGLQYRLFFVGGGIIAFRYILSGYSRNEHESCVVSRIGDAI